MGKIADNLKSYLGHKNKHIIIVGAISAVVVMLGSFIINIGSGSEARLLLESMLPSVRFLCSAVMTAAATILTLMLTLLSISGSKDVDFKKAYYRQVRQLATVNTIIFIGATILLLLVSVPLSESQDVPENWFTVIYYVTLTASALLGGGLIGMVLMLFKAIHGLINLMSPEEESRYVHRPE